MRHDNWKHFDVVKSLADRYSYREYEKQCSDAGIIPKSVLEYAQKVGLLTVAEGLYPDRSSKDAYAKLFEEYSEAYGGVSTVQPEPSIPDNQVQDSSTTVGCGTCGGGKVL